MSVTKLFWVDPYLTETQAIIITINEDKITLDQTVAYAVSGGQDSDSGTIGGYEILAAEKLADLVQGNFEIISGYIDEANQKRFWEIKGFAKVPCGGTHLKHTGEIGELCLKRKNIGGGKERFEITLT